MHSYRFVLSLAACLTAAIELNAAAIRDLSAFPQATLARNDDGSAGDIGLPFAVNFFGQTQNLVNINNNGNLTFGLGQSMSTFTPFGLTGNTGTSIIAPFFADVDTRNIASREVTYGNVTVDGNQAFAANYAGVGYYSSQADRTNDFQVLLIDRSSDTGNAGDFDIEFNYNSIQWETGTASGGTNGFGGNSARAGYSNGTGDPGTFFELGGSGVNGAFLDGGSNSLASGSFNSGTAGRYVFEVRNGAPIEPGTLPSLPIMPNVIVPGTPTTPPVFQFSNATSGRWFDPPIVYGFEFDMLGDSLFTGLTMPLGSQFGSLVIEWEGGNSGPFDNSLTSQSFTFAGSGVRSFRITGINPLLDPADPNFNAAFPIFLNFNTDAADFSMTSLVNDVPEPGSIVLVTAGVAALAWVRRRRAQI